MKEIRITDIEGIRIGQAEDAGAGSGCTVVICENGASAGMDIRGGGPASRESGLLDPLASMKMIHAVVLSGGSAFGLDASSGVLRYLEEHDIGYDVGVTRVPLVCQSALFDLTVGNLRVRPDRHMGYRACEAAEHGNYRDGNYGAGTGATVGKFKGMDYCMKSGIGSYAVQVGDFKIGAIAAVNALGDIYDPHTGQQIAGLLNEDRNGFLSSAELMCEKADVVENRFVENTTLGIVITNGIFDKAGMTRIAGMTHNGYARCIKPVHTSADGDTIYALSTGAVSADIDMTGTLAADVMSEAILRAVNSAESAYGYPARRDLDF